MKEIERTDITNWKIGDVAELEKLDTNHAIKEEGGRVYLIMYEKEKVR